jgi:hypothetical protein
MWKMKGLTLHPMNFALKIIVGCDILGLQASYQGICFGHAFSKVN